MLEQYGSATNHKQSPNPATHAQAEKAVEQAEFLYELLATQLRTLLMRMRLESYGYRPERVVTRYAPSQRLDRDKKLRPRFRLRAHQQLYIKLRKRPGVTKRDHLPRDQRQRRTARDHPRQE